MRRLHVISSVNPAGGGPIEGIKQLAAATAPKGHTAEVASLDAPDAPWVKECPLPVHALGPARGSYKHSPNLVPWLQQNASRYDVVIANGLWQFTSYATYLALRGTGQRYFVFPHGMLDPWFKRTYPLKHLKKCLYWPWGEYRVLRNAAGVCFTCEEERRLARESFWPYQCNEIVVNYGTAGPPAGSDVEAQKAAFLSDFPALANKRLLLFLSRIHVKKGCDLLIEAFAQHAERYPDLHLVMAGPDKTNWRPELEALAARRGVADRITWPGMLTGDRKWGAFRAAEAFVLPSHQENFGIAVAEALACGVPVLIADKVNIWSEIAADTAGLVEPDTQEGTSRLLARWLALSDAERIAMGRQAITCFRERFEIGRAGDRLIEVLQGQGGAMPLPEQPAAAA